MKRKLRNNRTTSLKAAVVMPGKSDPVAVVAEHELLAKFDQALQSLVERDRVTINIYLGKSSDRPCTKSEIKSALKTLAEALKGRGLEELLR